MPDHDLVRQMTTRLRQLEAAGIDWLPRINEPPVIHTAPQVHTAQVDPIQQRRQELAVLAECVSRCDRCPELVATRTQTVFGVGPANAEICFVGEAPGADEDRKGEPFVGAAGQLMNRIIIAMGMKREDIFICNILRCRPPGNRQPRPNEADNCREYLEKTLEIVAPKIICCWGATAAQNLLQTSTGITRLRGKFYQYRDIPVLCTFHPASLLEGRSPENKKFVWEDMKMILAHLGKPIPEVKKKSE
jgi:uracil-DNA glycosylase family 4